jgi:hypothetical protein
MTDDDRFDHLEKNLHIALRGQPSLRAPSSLEQRVRAEIARRASRPWWQRSFSEWPLLPRVAFVALSSCAACISIAVALTMLNGPGAEIASVALQKFSALRTAGDAVVTSVAQLFGSVSSRWLYLACAIFAAAYAGVLGLGATAYRLLWKSR